MHLDEKTQAFVDRMGMFYEHWGMTRTFGQLQGLLMVADGPVSLDELSQRLHVSKAAVSNTVRLYRELGFLRRIKRPGDRRDYYEMAPNSLETATEKKMAIFRQMVTIANEGIAAVNDPEHPAHDRLVETRAFYEYIAQAFVAMLDDWRARKTDIIKTQI